MKSLIKLKKVTKFTDSVLFENDANVLFTPFTL